MTTGDPAGFSAGDLVEYRSSGGDVVERGFVTRRSDRVVFVRFGLDMHAKACAASDLRLVPVATP